MASSRGLCLVACATAVWAVAAADVATAAPRFVDRHGVVYRQSGGRFYFHPLLSFQRLNGQMLAGRRKRANRLGRLLIARGRPVGRALVWEYGFAYAGAPPPWRSGMAQAVAAEALARAGYLRAARQAFLGVRDLLARPYGHVWIKLYSFSTVPVLNAQLQTALSLDAYATLARDPRAARLARRLLAAADALFPRFETACWSRYAIDGREAPPLYHRYVGELVTQIVARTRSASWRTRATRLYASQHRPALARLRGPRTLYPVPADGFRDAGTFSFWLSKCAWVTLRVGRREARGWFPPGRHKIAWRPLGVPGDYPATLSAFDSAGRRTTVALPRLVVRRDRRAPEVGVRAAGPRLRWRARDATTPWLRLSLVLHAYGGRVVLPVGRHPLSGAALLPTLPWPAYGVLLVSDSSGNTTRVPLGEVGPLGRLGRRDLFAPRRVRA